MFDFCEHDLAGLLSNAHVKFTLSEIKKVMQMLLNGLYYIHRNKVMGQICALWSPCSQWLSKEQVSLHRLEGNPSVSFTSRV